MSILDESSDLEQLQHEQLPGSIHGGNLNSHIHANNNSMSSQGQFSALSRGQLFSRDHGHVPTSNNDSGFGQGLNGLSSGRRLSLDSLDALTAEHMQSPESLESVQITLENNIFKSRKTNN